jgi:uncharacterized RmlC-like cupin family protein
MPNTYGVAVVKPGQTYEGAQGITYGAGASAETVGARRICMNVMPIPPGGRAKVHHHQGIETVALLLEGEVNVYYGDTLEHLAEMTAGDHIYIPEDVAHAPYNQSDAPCKIIVAHSSGSDQDGIVMLPHLDAVLAKK